MAAANFSRGVESFLIMPGHLIHIFGGRLQLSLSVKVPSTNSVAVGSAHEGGIHDRRKIMEYGWGILGTSEDNEEMVVRHSESTKLLANRPKKGNSKRSSMSTVIVSATVKR